MNSKPALIVLTTISAVSIGIAAYAITGVVGQNSKIQTLSGTVHVLSGHLATEKADLKKVDSTLKTDDAAIGDVLKIAGDSSEGTLGIIGNTAIGYQTLTYAISHLEQAINCLEGDIGDIEYGSSTYSICQGVG